MINEYEHCLRLIFKSCPIYTNMLVRLLSSWIFWRINKTKNPIQLWRCTLGVANNTHYVGKTWNNFDHNIFIFMFENWVVLILKCMWEVEPHADISAPESFRIKIFKALSC